MYPPKNLWRICKLSALAVLRLFAPNPAVVGEGGSSMGKEESRRRSLRPPDPGLNFKTSGFLFTFFSTQKPRSPKPSSLTETPRQGERYREIVDILGNSLRDRGLWPAPQDRFPAICQKSRPDVFWVFTCGYPWPQAHPACAALRAGEALPAAAGLQADASHPPCCSRSEHPCCGPQAHTPAAGGEPRDPPASMLHWAQQFLFAFLPFFSNSHGPFPNVAILFSRL